MGRFTAQDDLLHDIEGRPHGRESLFWVMPLPAHGLALLAYVFKDAGSGAFGRFVGVADRVAPDALHLDMAADVAFEGDDLAAFAVGGLRVTQPEPLRTATLSYASDGVALDVELEALHAPFSWHDGRDGCFSWAADERFEQSMRTSGTVTAGGRTVEFEGVGHRDHSWGTRDWRPLQHWKWINATAHDHSVSLHGWVSFALGDRQVNGYVNRGGEVRPIATADCSAELDDALMHSSVTGRFVDTAGDELVLEATSVAGLAIPGGHTRMHEIACAATLDGAPADAHVELGWPGSYVEQFTG